MKVTQLYRKHNGENSITSFALGEVNSQVSLQQNVPNFIEPSVWLPNSLDINPLDYAVWGSLQQDVTEF